MTVPLLAFVTRSVSGVRFTELDRWLQMKFEINKRGSEPVHLQLREQIIFRISTRELQIGQVMPSCRALSRQLDISSNTVSSVYKELVDERWLVKRRGSQHVVVQRKTAIPDLAQINSLEDLVDSTIHLAQERGYSLQQLAARLGERMLEQPPDHLLIIEPEPEMGELMRTELRQAIGQAPSGCSIAALRHAPSKAVGAVLLTPTYLEDRLEYIPAGSHHVVPLTYLPVDAHLAIVRNLTQPSMVGMVSISPAILQTVGQLFAPIVGARHTLHQFLMQWPVGGDGPHFKHYSPKDYPKGRTPIRKNEKAVLDSDVQPSAASDDPPQCEEDSSWVLTAADLGFVDILFCDSITFAAVKHRRRIRCKMLSAESLEAVAAAAKSLTQTMNQR